MKKIKINTPAVDFDTTDYLGNSIKLSSYKGQKVFISFFRGASCPFCNMRIKDLLDNYDSFQKRGIEVITFFASSADEIKKYAGNQKPPFVIIPDEKLVYYIKYGVEKSQSGMFKAMAKPLKMMKMMFSGFFSMKSLVEEPIIPADFLINKSQIVEQVYYGNDFGDHLELKNILK